MRIVDAMGVDPKGIPTAMLEMANLLGKKMEVMVPKVVSRRDYCWKHSPLEPRCEYVKHRLSGDCYWKTLQGLDICIEIRFILNIYVVKLYFVCVRLEEASFLKARHSSKKVQGQGKIRSECGVRHSPISMDSK
jgi:hypothetical protein